MNTHRATLLLVAALSTTSACKRRPTQTQNNQGATDPSANGQAANGAPSNGANAPTGPTISGQTQGESSVRSVPPTPATGCPAQLANGALGPGTVHNATINTNETWTLEGSPHRFPDGAVIAANTTVTVAPCAVVLVGSDHMFQIEAGGAIMAVGDAAHPIRFGSDKNDPQAGDWDNIHFDEQARRSSRLAFVTIEHGGSDTGADVPSCLHNYLAGLDLQHVTIRACRGYGVFMQDNGTFSDTSTQLVVREGVVSGASQAGAVHFSNPNSVRTLPEGTYSGNEVSEVFVRSGTVTSTGTWRNPGVRYRVADDAELRVEGPASPVLTIAPGTTIAFGSSANFTIGWDGDGALTADGGSEASRITFTAAAAEPNPGAWEGVFIGERAIRSRTKLAWVTISYAAGDSGYDNACPPSEQDNDAALYLTAPLSADAVSHVKFTNLPENTAAIGRTWAAGPTTSFATPALGNDFAQSGNQCRQTPLRTAEGCADNARCD